MRYIVFGKIHRLGKTRYLVPCSQKVKKSRINLKVIFTEPFYIIQKAIYFLEKFPEVLQSN